MSKETVIQAQNVTFSFDNLPVLEDVNFEVEERDFVSIIGPNGGGKTTLLKLILGIYQPDKGDMVVYGKSPRRARQRIGYVSQSQNYDPKFPARVIDVVLMGRLDKSPVLGPYRKKDRQEARNALEKVGLLDYAHRPLANLSGGQQQRVIIARALACEPDMLLLDEPTASLDLTVEASLYELLRELNENLTIIMVSHDIGFVSELVSKVLCVKRQVLAHPTSEITGEMINEIYGSEVQMVRHDHA